MKSALKTLVAPALLLATFALPVTGQAQTAANAPPAAAPMAPTPASPSAASTQVEQRITDLHMRLHITAAQDAEWNKFAQVMRDNAQRMSQTLMERGQKFKSFNAVDDMQSYAQITEEHAQDMQKLLASFKDLYAALTEPQKQAADQLFRNYTAAKVQAHAPRG